MILRSLIFSGVLLLAACSRENNQAGKDGKGGSESKVVAPDTVDDKEGVENENPPEEPEEDSSQQDGAQAEVNYRILVGEPGFYEIQFRWQNNTNRELRLRYLPGEEMELMELPLSGAEGTWTHEGLPFDSQLYYAFEERLLDGSEFRLLEEFTIQLPKDLILTSPVVLKDLQRPLVGINRVFLGPNAILTTNGDALRIEAKTIISDGGVIQTYPDGATASLGEQGRPGGIVRIKAEKLQGSLKIAMRGQNGGQGRSGRKGPNGQPGAKGPRVLVTDLQRAKICTRIKPYKRHEFESKHPARGTPGGSGGRGYEGEIGLPGGDSGHLYFELVEYDPDSIQVEHTPGKGGFGGAGGEGGDGGPEGLLGDILHANRQPCLHQEKPCCESPPLTRVGSKGPAGPPGAVGPAGKFGFTEGL